MKLKRVVAFDILRVIAMFMVIVIHVSNVYSRRFGQIENTSYLFSLIYNTISRISVPIFLMISGALMLDRKFDKKKFKNRILKFIILIISWNIIYLVWEYFYLDIKYDKLYMLLIEPYRAHLWFLYTIIVLYFLQPVLKKIMDFINVKTKIVLLCLWFAFGIVSIFNSFIAQCFSLLCYAGYFIVGKYLYDFVEKRDFKKYTVISLLIIIICYSLSIFLNYSFSIKYNMFYNKFFAYRTPFILIPSILLFSLIVTYSKKINANKILMILSDVSLGVYLIHGIFLDIVVKLFINNSLNTIIEIPICSIIIIILSVLSVYILKKIKFVKKIL